MARRVNSFRCGRRSAVQVSVSALAEPGAIWLTARFRPPRQTFIDKLSGRGRRGPRRPSQVRQRRAQTDDGSGGTIPAVVCRVHGRGDDTFMAGSDGRRQAIAIVSLIGFAVAALLFSTSPARVRREMSQTAGVEIGLTPCQQRVGRQVCRTAALARPQACACDTLPLSPGM